MDRVAVERFGATFVELEPDPQDQVLAAIDSGQVSGWSPALVTSEEFFGTVRSHTIIGFLTDPKYGGNRDHAGWKVVGYPGPRHDLGGYTPAQMIGEERIRAI